MAALQCKQFLIGLPGAGKTTFLAALWHVLNSAEVEGALELERLLGDQEHLNTIRDLWCDVQPLQRTKVGSEIFVSMLLKNPNSNSATEVFFPDLSGESFRLQWTDRQMKLEHAKLIRDAVGGLFLIHPETVIEETLISDAENIIKRIETARQAKRDNDSSADRAIKGDTNLNIDQISWDAEKAPTQIQLVDLLQFISFLNTTRPIKLAVVVSAWDSITSEISPSDWIKKRLPLLSQYLTSNFEIFMTAFYGVSAQGGKLEDADELRKKIQTSERIRVVENDLSESHDITAPVRWIMEPLT